MCCSCCHCARPVPRCATAPSAGSPCCTTRQLTAAARALHRDLAHPWTVEELAREARMSRSAFAAAFTDTTGHTPLGYLTSWRMYRAKTLLKHTRRTVGDIALEVGYSTGASLSRVFTRAEGISPTDWRRGAAVQ